MRKYLFVLAVLAAAMPIVSACSPATKTAAEAKKGDLVRIHGHIGWFSVYRGSTTGKADFTPLQYYVVDDKICFRLAGKDLEKIDLKIPHTIEGLVGNSAPLSLGPPGAIVITYKGVPLPLGATKQTELQVQTISDD